MFEKMKSNLETIIGPDTIFQGTIKTRESVRIDGRLEGGILGACKVIIEKEGEVQGDITAKDVTVGGKVTGNITTEHYLEVKPKSQVFGDIKTTLLSIGEGAIFEGHSIMSTEQNEVIEMNSDE
jgi:cytoskeletal protein CcmA (bactofilin family)